MEKHYFLLLVGVGLITLGLLSAIIRKKCLLPLDIPNQRSLHAVAIPRGGGLALLLGVTLIFPWLIGSIFCQIWLMAVFLAAISYLDDWVGVPILLRLLAQLSVSCLFVQSFGGSYLFLVGLVCFLVWMTNLYNFMDGADGLAGGMAVFGFGAYAFLAWLRHDQELTVLAMAIVIAAFAFLMFNFPPARVFLGDVGSIPLGFLAGALGLIGWQQQHWSLFFPMLVFSPFILDATFTLVKRILRRELFWCPHRTHNYQLLIQQGLSHRGTAYIYYGLMLLSVGLAVSLEQNFWQNPHIMAALLGVFYLVFFAAIHYRWYRIQKGRS